MKPWTKLDQALTPDGKVLSLEEHDGTYAIRVDGVPLMSTRQHSSEEKLAELACARLRTVRGARVLIGGLGFGFTLKAALAALPDDADIVLAEILGAVIDWNRNPSFGLAAQAMADPRVTVRRCDAGTLIRESRDTFDAIILDVDNGPAALSTQANAHLYSFEGLRDARAALRPSGCVAFWSVAPDAAFERLLAQSGFAVEVVRTRAHKTGGRWHTLFVGRRK